MKHLFVSAELSTLSQSENKARTKSLGNILGGLSQSGFKVTPVQGCYMGVMESSFRVTCPDGDLFNLNMLRGLARNLNQHSILWVRDDGASFLDYMECGTMHHLGTIGKVESSEGLDAYSVIEGKIYSIK